MRFSLRSPGVAASGSVTMVWMTTSKRRPPRSTSVDVQRRTGGAAVKLTLAGAMVFELPKAQLSRAKPFGRKSSMVGPSVSSRDG